MGTLLTAIEVAESRAPCAAAAPATDQDPTNRSGTGKKSKAEKHKWDQGDSPIQTTAAFDTD
ncbi:hypothetical protein E2562_018630 [Oryza meyeriana var. granulata]|uniref:Uncharacterized protein n=1 Tax=Oryza meyeriana var. granulata TaxID=110450 RepID=A0A6G1BXV3_9ORYZ|nr:hypothetical protein E2562_018630 [Oryza meyeriana var. granulata]